MIELVAFDKRGDVDDGYGNTVTGDWTEQFRERAEFVFIRGSEAVIAGRLESTESFVMRIYSNARTRTIKPDWQARDVRRGESYNVLTIEEDKSRAVLDLWITSNVATG